MQQIEQDIYISNTYPGVTLGALALPFGILLIDAPLHPDDGRSWYATVCNLGGGAGRLLVSLDAHTDRTLGIRVMDCPMMSHEETALAFENRPSIFKAQPLESGAEWEYCEGLSGLRWAKPTLTFTEEAILKWGEYSIHLEHRPGPAPGAIWLNVPEASVVFIGDAVVVNQPPFLADADIPAWIATLDVLLSAAYRNYLVISGRGGVIDTPIIREQRKYLKEVLKRLERLHKRNAPPEATESLIEGLLARLDFPTDRREQYEQRLRYGLHRYYTRHYYPDEEGEE